MRFSVFYTTILLHAAVVSAVPPLPGPAELRHAVVDPALEPWAPVAVVVGIAVTLAGAALAVVAAVVGALVAAGA